VIKLIRHADAHRINVAAQLFDHRRRRAEANGKFAGSQRRFSAQRLSHGLKKRRNSPGRRGFSGMALKLSRRPLETHG